MKYDKGNLILSEEERELLVFATMNEINPQYPAPYFVGSMAEVKAEAEARRRRGSGSSSQSRILLTEINSGYQSSGS